MSMTDFYLDRMNWANDRRNCSDQTKPIVIYISDEEVELPTKWEVCEVCGGEGKHVNPSIDCGGLSSEDFYDDPEFAEDYFAGAFDVECNACHGRTTVRVVDEARLTPELLKAWREHQEEEAHYQAMCRSEFIHGC